MLCVKELGFRVATGAGFRIQVKVSGLLRVQGSGFRVQDLGFGVYMLHMVCKVYMVIRV